MDKKQKESAEAKPFIRETIQEKPRSFSWKRLALIPVMAAVFGVVAALTFALTGPLFQDMLTTTEDVRESVTIPMDEDPSMETTQEETTAPETTMSEETREEALRESVEVMVEEMLRDYLAKEESREISQDPACVVRVGEIAASLRQSLVTVTSLQADEDVFSQSFVRSQNSFGVILAITGEDVRIATENQVMEEAEGVRVSFADGTSSEGELLGRDSITGFAVVSVPLEALPESLRESLVPAALGNSYFCAAGDMVVALGSPLDYVPSVAWGIVSYIQENVHGTDRNFRLIQTDIAANADAGGILVNSAGEMIGWVTSRYSEEDQRGLLAAIAISDIKDLAEKLTNGYEAAKLGVQVQMITDDLAEQESLPKGLYVVHSLDDSPAYEAGIQNGDVLVQFDDKNLVRTEDLRTALLERKPGDEAEITVMRSGRDGYTEKTFTVTLDKR